MFEKIPMRVLLYRIAKPMAVLLVLSVLACPGCGKGFQLDDGKPAFVGWAGGRTVQYLKNADPATFKAMPTSDDAEVSYATDANNVYIGMYNNAMTIELANPSDFSILTTDGAYAADKDRVFWFGVEIPGADPATFKIARAPYAIDDERAYAGVTPFDVHSLSDFEVVSVFLFGRPITPRNGRLEIDDPSEAYISGWSRDGVAYYWGAVELEGAKYDTLTILSEYYAKDDSRVYYTGKLVQGADAATFVAGPAITSGKDKDYYYEEGKRTKPVENDVP